VITGGPALMRRVALTSVVAATMAGGSGFPAEAQAGVRVGAQAIQAHPPAPTLATLPSGVSTEAADLRVSTPTATAVITRSPYALSISDTAGRRVLGEVPNPGPAPQVVPPLAQSALPADNLSAPTLYAPLSFLVGATSSVASPAGQFEGNLLTEAQTGVQYSAQNVLSATPQGGGLALILSTDDPSGRRLLVSVTPGPGGTIHVSARPSDPAGVVEMSDSFSSTPSEAYRGFGGRHNSLDEHGQAFFNYLQQENVGAGGLQPLADLTAGPTVRPCCSPTVLPPPTTSTPPLSLTTAMGSYSTTPRHRNGVLTQTAPTRGRPQFSDRKSTTTSPQGNYPDAVGQISAISGRQRVPPAWGSGPLLDRATQYLNDSASHYYAEVLADLQNIKRYHLPLDGYRIEGWRYLTTTQLQGVIARLRAMAIHPMVYFCAFVGQTRSAPTTPPTSTTQ